jgi:hypothetical protein
MPHIVKISQLRNSSGAQVSSRAGQLSIPTRAKKWTDNIGLPTFLHLGLDNVAHLCKGPVLAYLVILRTKTKS